MENEHKIILMSDELLEQWAKLRADDAGRIARELVRARQLMREFVQVHYERKIKPLSWSDPKKPCEECRYDHVRSETSIGNYQIEWKGWKDYPGYTLYFGGNYIDAFDGLIEAKIAAFEHAKKCVKGMIE